MATDTQDFERQAASTAPPVYRQPPVQRRPGPPRKRKASRSGPSPKVRKAIDFMVWGGKDGIPLTRKEAAQAAGIADVTLRNALANPLVMKYYNEQLEVLRSGARPRAFHQIVELSEGAKAEGTRLKAAIYAHGGHDRGDVNVNIQVANIVPGYMVDVSSYGADPKVLEASGSVASVLEGQSEAKPADD